MHKDRNDSDYHDIDFGKMPAFMSEVYFLLLLQCTEKVASEFLWVFFYLDFE